MKPPVMPRRQLEFTDRQLWEKYWMVTKELLKFIKAESMRYNMEEARDVANAYALELGFEAVDVSMTSENSCVFHQPLLFTESLI